MKKRICETSSISQILISTSRILTNASNPFLCAKCANLKFLQYNQQILLSPENLLQIPYALESFFLVLWYGLILQSFLQDSHVYSRKMILYSRHSGILIICLKNIIQNKLSFYLLQYFRCHQLSRPALLDTRNKNRQPLHL